jgi:hypothetical protein
MDTQQFWFLLILISKVDCWSLYIYFSFFNNWSPCDYHYFSAQQHDCFLFLVLPISVPFFCIWKLCIALGRSAT